jgi:hypothetical protein
VVQPDEVSEQGGLAAAAAAQDDHNLPFEDGKVEVFKNGPVAIAGREVFYLDNGRLLSLRQNSTLPGIFWSLKLGYLR